MSDKNENHRGHTIISGVSGPNLNNGPLVAFYTVWTIEENNSYRAVLQGSLDEVFHTISDAHSASLIKAKYELDKILDGE